MLGRVIFLSYNKIEHQQLNHSITVIFCLGQTKQKYMSFVNVY